MVWLVANKIRAEEGDQEKNCTEEVKASGSVTMRVSSSDRTARIANLAGRMVAMYAPSGLGMEWADAAGREHQ